MDGRKGLLIVSNDSIRTFDGWFDRKEYMKIHKGISTATASRDLKQLLQDGKLESSGAGRMTKYKKRV
jgi:hypothetical protein